MRQPTQDPDAYGERGEALFFNHMDGTPQSMAEFSSFDLFTRNVCMETFARNVKGKGVRLALLIKRNQKDPPQKKHK
jgi:hypothetical protein